MEDCRPRFVRLDAPWARFSAAPRPLSPGQPVGKTDARSQVLMFGGTPQRNMVNLVDKNTPIDWSIEDGKKKNIKWVANLGSYCYGGPIIADGKVYVGTNNANPRDKSIKGLRAVLMAFRESDGEFLWQIVHGNADGESEAYRYGLCSTPSYEDSRLYYVTPGCEVVCAGSDGKVKWSYDMAAKLKVVPYHLANCSPLIVGDLLMVCTSNGVDEEGKLPSPKAPSFIAIDKNTGSLNWQSDLPGKKIIEGQWSNPTPRRRQRQAAGDLRRRRLRYLQLSSRPPAAHLEVQLQSGPRAQNGRRDQPLHHLHARRRRRHAFTWGSAFIPIMADRCLIAISCAWTSPRRGTRRPRTSTVRTRPTRIPPWSGRSAARSTRPPRKALASISAPSPAPSAPLPSRTAWFTSPRSAAILHCLDAKTGQRYWLHDFRNLVWGSAYWVDGKVYVGTQEGDVAVFAHGKEKKILATVNMDEQIESTPVVAGGVLYVATKSKLYAIGNGK